MKKLVLSAFVIAAISFTSCNNDDNVGGENVDITKMYLPLKLTSDGYTTTFTYNNKGQVTKIVESDGYEYTFSYNGNQLVEFAHIETGGKTTYTYQQNGTEITLNMKGEYGEDIYNDTNTLTIDAKGNLISEDEAIFSYDGNGNNIKVTYEDGETATQTFDTKNGVFKNLNLPKWVSTYLLYYNTSLVNNVLTFNFVSPDFPEDNNSAVVVYEYNADGYPTKVTSTITDESGTDVETQTIEYTKK